MTTIAEEVTDAPNGALWPVDEEALGWLKASRQTQGLPVRLEDKAALRRLWGILQA